MEDAPPPPHPPPQLPTEIVARIIQLTQTTPNVWAFEFTSAILRRYSLVNRTWCGLAQAELFSFPSLSETEAASSFSKQLQGVKGARLAAHVKCVSFWGSEMPRGCKCCPS